MSANVVMYSSMWCGYCHRARSLLESKGVAFEDIVVDGKPALRKEMEARSGAHTVPQIFINERPVGGSEDLARLEASGELDRLLTTAPASEQPAAGRSTLNNEHGKTDHD